MGLFIGLLSSPINNSTFFESLFAVFYLTCFRKKFKIQNEIICCFTVFFEIKFRSYKAGILVILWMSLSPLIWGDDSMASHFHSYLTIVFATVTIFFIGFLSAVLLQKNKTKVRLTEV